MIRLGCLGQLVDGGHGRAILRGILHVVLITSGICPHRRVGVRRGAVRLLVSQSRIVGTHKGVHALFGHLNRARGGHVRFGGVNEAKSVIEHIVPSRLLVQNKALGKASHLGVRWTRHEALHDNHYTITSARLSLTVEDLARAAAWLVHLTDCGSDVSLSMLSQALGHLAVHLAACLHFGDVAPDMGKP